MKIEDIRKKQEFQEFVEWIAQPAKLRDPKDQIGLAQKLGVDNATLSDWKKVEGFWDEVRKLRKDWVQDKVSNILLGVYSKALKGDVNAAKLLMEYSNEFTETSEIKHRIEGVLTAEQQEKIQQAIEYAKGDTKQNIQDKSSQE